MQNEFLRCGICAYLKTTKYREDAQGTYLEVSENKKYYYRKFGHFTA